MIQIPIKAFPLSWPISVPRTGFRSDSSFGRRVPPKDGRPARFERPEVGPASDELFRNLRLIRGSANHVISSNLPTRDDGLPYADATARGGDPGVCAYWTIGAKRGDTWVRVPYCMPCDKWKRVADNLHALALSIEASFAALPPGADENASPPRRPWREVLGMPVFDTADRGRDACRRSTRRRTCAR